MKRLKFLICIAFAAIALAACDKADNPVDSGEIVDVNNPQENVTDQPAYSSQE